jgi:invasion protein IalB
VRITNVLRFAAVVGFMGVLFPPAAFAQDQQPAAGQQNFGPRIKAGQPGAGQTAQAAQQPPPAETVSTHGAWQIQCGTAPSADGTIDPAAKKQCGMVQVTHSEKNDKIGLSLIIVKAKQGDKDVLMMRVMAPIGVYLPTGVALEIDTVAVGRVPFTRCRPQICEAFAEASPETLAKMKKGTIANFIIYEAPGIGIPMKISLDGFGASLTDLNAQ